MNDLNVQFRNLNALREQLLQNYNIYYFGYIRFLSEEPHIAGRPVDEVVLVDYISDLWEEYGLEVEIHPYDVLLSYPNQ